MASAQRILNVYDFDGTVTRRDSLLEFLRYCFGWPRLVGAFMIFSPLLLLMKLGLSDNGRTKERIFSHFFKGMPEGRFNEMCIAFGRARGAILRLEAMASIRAALSRPGEKVVILSASIINWVQPFFTGMDVAVLGTEIDIRDGVLTGRFQGPNCYGAEKARRLHRFFPPDVYDILKVYGDSRGDWELMQMAHQSFYKIFK